MLLLMPGDLSVLVSSARLLPSVSVIFPHDSDLIPIPRVANHAWFVRIADTIPQSAFFQVTFISRSSLAVLRSLGSWHKPSIMLHFSHDSFSALCAVIHRCAPRQDRVASLATWSRPILLDFHTRTDGCGLCAPSTGNIAAGT